MDSKSPAYTTVTGVKIGSMYDRNKAPCAGRDMELLQAALLTPSVVRPNFLARLIAFVRRMGHTL